MAFVCFDLKFVSGMESTLNAGAQGPLMERQVIKLVSNFLNFSFLHVLEPINTVAPRIISGNDIKVVSCKANTTFTLMCNAQSFPVAVFK